jgi:hypothetical protein
MIDGSMPPSRCSHRVDLSVAVLSLLLAGACASTSFAPRPPLSSEEKTRLDALAADLEADRGLALILIAEGPGLSAPFRLSYGNPLRSSFVLSFLHCFLPLVPEARRLLPVDEAIDRALALQWKRDPGAAAAFRIALAGREPFTAADPALLAGLARVGESDLLAAGETIGRQVQAGGWDNARTLLDLAVLNVNAQRPGQAAEILRGLLARPNVRSASLLAEARRLLDEAGRASAP